MAPANRLARETSPYLLQHAHNPVDWYPWGPEALARAKAEDKPILLSVGYSACHWCHVMERESFEDPAVARLMNESFVCIKVDREERPDLDQLYQTAAQILSGRGGWPLTMFLTPALEPFFGGTYYPPERRYGMPSFSEVLRGVATAWTTRRVQVHSSADQLTEAIRDLEQGEGAPGGQLARAVVRAAVNALLPRFDPDHGGFGSRPKFPNTALLELWLRWGTAETSASDFVDRVAFAFERMAAGGIYDQLGGGFARYSTDERWLVPHFEKMLYDNAQLLKVGAELHLVTGRPPFARVVRETVEWLRREMTGPTGGFYSTQDADSEGEEGRFFVWEEAELDALLGADSALFKRVYGVQPGGNFEHGRTVLSVVAPVEAAARLEGVPEAEAPARLERARRILFEAREKRVKPHRDDKVLAGWNGLMIEGLAVASAIDPSALPLAEAASLFVERELDAGGRLLRTWRNGRAHTDAFAEDYAFLAAGELALFEATGITRHFERAKSLVDRALALFLDREKGGFFLTRADGEPLLARPKAQYDNAVPGASSTLALVLPRLHALTGEARYAEAAEQTLRAYSDAMAGNAFGYAYLLCALDAATAGVGTLVITGAVGDPAREALLAAARGRYLPNLVVVPHASGDLPPALAPLLAGKPEGAAAYLCRNGTCSLPARTPEELAALLAR